MNRNLLLNLYFFQWTNNFAKYWASERISQEEIYNTVSFELNLISAFHCHRSYWRCWVPLLHSSVCQYLWRIPNSPVELDAKEKRNMYFNILYLKFFISKYSGCDTIRQYDVTPLFTISFVKRFWKVKLDRLCTWFMNDKIFSAEMAQTQPDNPSDSLDKEIRPSGKSIEKFGFQIHYVIARLLVF